jgi:phytoene dehydrogenase-like protein
MLRRDATLRFPIPLAKSSQMRMQIFCRSLLITNLPFSTFNHRGADLVARISPAATLARRLSHDAPNLSRRIVLAEHVESPLDLERRNPANWRGSCHGGANSPEQSGYFRPVEGWSSYRTPVEGLYQNGACTHPGGSVSGLPGRNCARVLLQDLGSSLEDAVAHRQVAKP